MPKGIYKHNKGYKREVYSQDWKDKISESCKGRKAWNKGLKAKDHPGLLKSVEAAHKALKGKPAWNKGKIGLQKSKFKGIKRPEMSGEKSPMFTGTNLDYYKKKIKIRDDYTCQICELRDEEIMQVDHILPVSKFPELKMNMDNMRTLCPNCHARKSAKEKRTKTWDGLV